MRLYLFASLVAGFVAIPVLAQPPQPAEPEVRADPTAPSPLIRETEGEIRGVSQLDRLMRELEQLKKENEDLRQQLAQQSTAALPAVVIRGRVVGERQTLVILEIDKKSYFARPGMQVLVPVGQNQSTPMLVKEITPEAVELEFTELDRTVLLHE